jgi:hypothetical protein
MGNMRQPLGQADPEAFARSWAESWNAHDPSRIAAHFSPAVEYHSPLVARLTGGQALHGRTAVDEYAAASEPDGIKRPDRPAEASHEESTPCPADGMGVSFSSNGSASVSRANPDGSSTVQLKGHNVVILSSTGARTINHSGRWESRNFTSVPSCWIDE